LSFPDVPMASLFFLVESRLQYLKRPTRQKVPAAGNYSTDAAF